MKKYTQKAGFTLVEVLVAITIFSIMMISVMGVYLVATSVTYKSDLSRAMQENVKYITTTMGEDILTHKIIGKFGEPQCTGIGNGFCMENDIKYYLAQKSGNTYVTVSNPTKCIPTEGTPYKQCFLVQDDGQGNKAPITNNLVSVERADFSIQGDSPKILTAVITLAIDREQGVREGLIKNSKLTTQITLSERINSKTN